MTLDEFIEELQQIRITNGNVDVFICDDGWCMEIKYIENNKSEIIIHG